MTVTLDCEQGSAKWFAARLGCVTSSRVDDAISVLTRKSKNGSKGDETQARKNLRMELVCERMIKKASDHYVNKWMEEGKEKEPLARTAYEMKNNLYVEQVGFGFHPTIKMAGASPDGLVGNDGMVEFKCPKLSTHLKYVISGVVPEEYKPQMYWQMACFEREWNDFGSCFPDKELPKDLRLFVGPRLYRDEAIIRGIEEEVEKFNSEVEELILKLDPNYIVDTLAASIALVEKKKAESAPGMEISDEDFKYLCP